MSEPRQALAYTFIPATHPELDDIENLPLGDIATLIVRDWKVMQTINRFTQPAWPYIEAMACMDKITDNYGAESGSMVVSYFMSNATRWRGDVARKVKAELNRRLKLHNKGGR